MATMATMRSPVDRLPDELVDMILFHATSCRAASTSIADGGMSADPFRSHFISLHLARRTRRAVVRVNRRWKRISERHIYCKITLEVGEKIQFLAARVAQLVSEGNPLAKTIRSLFVRRPRGPNKRCFGASLCSVLSHCTLSHFSTNYELFVPWFPVLVDRSASTLTHLDITLDPRVIVASTVTQLNCFTNLIWLRIDEDDEELIPHEIIHLDSFNTLPLLSLPLLQELHLITTMFPEHVHAEGYIGFHIGRTALLPSLTRLRLRGMVTLDTTIVEDMLHAFGSGLQELSVEVLDLDALDDIGTLAPLLTDLLCFAPPFFLENGGFDYQVEDSYDYALEHPALRRLTLNGEGVFFNALARIDPQKLPLLESITLAGISWSGDAGEQTGTNNRGDDEHVKDIRSAVELAEKGIPVTDEQGRTFGGLAVKGGNQT